METAIRALEDALDLAADAAVLGRLLERIRGLIAGWAAPGCDALAVGRAASRLYDAFLVRAAVLARPWPLQSPEPPDLADPPDPANAPALPESPEPPDAGGRFALVVLGSQGRREQFLATDQDNALILANDCDTAPTQAAFAAYAGRLAAVLGQAGMPPCPKGIMAASPDWRKTLSQWRDAIDAAAGRPDEAAVLTVSLLADVRPVWGDATLAGAVTAHLLRRVGETPLLARGLAREALRFGPPALLFGHLAAGRFGLGQHTVIDLKGEAVYPLILGIKALALDAGIAAPDTLGRLDGLVAARVLGEPFAKDVQSALNAIQALRLTAQAKAWRTGAPMENKVVPARLEAVSLSGLEGALKAAGRLRDVLEHHFSLRCLT
ncbi:signal transduction protein [Desulfovibrio aerotolerans]|uniref:Signal transduction protein n=1 Tax=Solidesulfovibrio aerotolerans TaxID=295255 RepID=A0A7C9NHX6_9BACT|nr:DUF294 nucleotidyltransferase-like domain-containing protein [Solidesulfovibrio aerotolerans]MYL82116.1 signal transduction protein [Solidesulfovibrio aerotolerans]